MPGSTLCSLSQPKGVGNEGQEQGVWTEQKQRTDSLNNASAGAELFQRAQTWLWEEVEKEGQRQFSRIRAEMVMTGDGLSAHPSIFPKHRTSQ